MAPPGCEQLDDRALLARLLRHVPTDPAVIASRLLERFGSLGAVAWADPAERARAAGTEPEALLDLEVQRDVAVRLARIEASRRPVISSWAALEAYARGAMAHRPREQFRVLFLDHRNRLMVEELVADGTVDHAPVYPREVIRRALEVSASALILVHNHPSGDPTPSRADIEMTRKVVEAAKALGLQVHDHLVVGREGTASFRGLGLI
ncbi:DNA repair protein RadC [Brevundimonas sp.]|uniref:RadC family protein n=1 Tax=Brevundimonas sp. TaxID=1871086 RepID=UPI0035B31A26